jgi:hypothetical protein
MMTDDEIARLNQFANQYAERNGLSMIDDNQFRRVDWSGDQPLPSDDDDEHGMPLPPPRGPGLSADDLELLTLAAKSIGARAEPVEGEQWVNLHFAGGTIQHGWNPLRHSDDTLQLLAAKKMNIHYADDELYIDGLDDMGVKTTACEQASEDRQSAIKRAVTRLAAEIGRAME